AAWRSGSLSTAVRAAELSRPVGAVPGPVTSMASAGCHRLLRDGAAVCVTDADEVAELAGVLSRDAAPSAPGDARGAPRRVAYDGLDDVETRAWDALPVRSGVPTEAVALGRLEIRGLAEGTPGGWRRARTP